MSARKGVFRGFERLANRSIPIDVIRAFVAVVEARGFTRAAEDLGRSQPTISLQVKRLEELIEAPLFEKVARFELTAVGSVCFDYGRRLLRLHDEMLDEAQQRKEPGGRLRIGMPGEFALRLTPLLDRLRLEENEARASFEIVTGESDALALAYRQNALDVAFLVGGETEAPAAARWRARLGWYARRGVRLPKPPKPAPLVLPPRGSPLHGAAAGALRAAGRPFAIVCASADFAVRSAAVSAGLGFAPMIDGLAPEGLAPSVEAELPKLPPIEILLVAWDEALAANVRLWASDPLSVFQLL
jgi:DNA-binding transcriptional LysR family regulator